MKQLVSILVSVLILLMSLQNTFILTSFKLNQEYIAENLCVEKDVQNSTCNGSCHLKESFKKVNSNEDNKTRPIFNETENLVLFNYPCNESQKDFYVKNESISISNDNIMYFEFVSNCFHPPQNILV